MWMLHLLFAVMAGFLPLLAAAVGLRFFLWSRQKKKADGQTAEKLITSRFLGFLFFCCLIIAILSVTGIPSAFDVGKNQGGVKLNLTPLVGLFSYTDHYALNILLFVPFGFFLPLLWRRCARFVPVVLYGALFSLCIELWQTTGFRVADIDDWMMNTIGATLGFCLFALCRAVFPRILVLQAGDEGARRDEPYFAVLAAWAAVFFVQPLLLNGLFRPVFTIIF